LIVKRLKCPSCPGLSKRTAIILLVVFIIAAVCISLVVVLNSNWFKIWLGGKAVEADVQIVSVRLTDISMTTAMVEVSVCVQNTNPIGATLDKIEYVIYFEKDDEWVQLGRGDRGDDIQIKAGDSTCFDVENKIDVLSAIVALYQAYKQDGSVNVKVSGTTWLKIWPVTVDIPFERIERVGF
jgi:LEA14-like dessication related protein